MSEFLAENNVCGQALLQICAIGNSIIAELLRLKDYIPEIYHLDKKEDQNKYKDIIHDFSYFKFAEVIDRKIENDPNLAELDDELRNNHLEILTRFYLAFESIYQYANDLKDFIQDLNGGLFIQQTIESVLQDGEGKQLLCESLYLYGTMLLLLDLYIPGVLRERLLVAYNRYSAQKTHGDSNIDDVCKLIRSTGFVNSSGAKKPLNYPEEYFQRIALDRMFVEMVIGRLRSDDVYNQISIFPLPEHRSIALANQAGMLVVCLFFAPKTLHTQNSRMREIVDKFFTDNWIVSIYMGTTMNLIDGWEGFKAARTALSNVVETGNVREIAHKQKEELQRLLLETRNILKEGSLTEPVLLNTLTNVTTLLRECNVCLRWAMLHTTTTIVDCSALKKCKQIREQVETDFEYKPSEVFELLLNTGQLELKMKDLLEHFLKERHDRWEKYKKECEERIQDLGAAFSGTQPLMKIEKNESLQKWFGDIRNEITALNYDEPSVAGRKMVHLIRALEEVQEFHNLEANMQVKQYLTETRQYLHQMIHCINIKDDVLVNLQLIGDLSYGWFAVDTFTEIMQESIKRQPNLVIKLRATFLKLSNSLAIPLLRIQQAQSEDLESVSKYYSSELVNYVRKVIQIVPKTIFETLTKIIELQTKTIKELPTRLEKEKLREYAQLDERFLVAKLTHSISVFTEGVLMMKTTLVGVISLDPKELLEDGIRNELVKNISAALHSVLTFNAKAKQSELEPKLNELAMIIDGYRRSFEYIQDFMNINGLRIWQEEFSRVINYNVEKECNLYLKNKIQDWQSVYQSTTVPIPLPVPVDDSITFMGRLAKELVKITDSRLTIYVALSTAWFDYKTHKELLNLKFMSKITDSVGAPGLSGLDKIFSFMINVELQHIFAQLQSKTFKDKAWTDTLDALAAAIRDDCIPTPAKFFTTFTARCTKAFPKFLDWVLRVGQLQILRRHISYELNINCKFSSKQFEFALRTFNSALLLEIQAHFANPAQRPLPSNELLSALDPYLLAAGLYQPYHKVYVATKASQYYSPFLFLLTIFLLPRLQYTKNVAEMTARKANDPLDGHPFMVGVLTILRQLDKEILEAYIAHLCLYAKSFVAVNVSAKQELSTEAQTALYYLDLFIQVAQVPRVVLEKYIPEAILNQYEYLSEKV